MAIDGQDLSGRLADEKRVRRSAESPVSYLPLNEPWDGPWPIVPGSILVLWGDRESDIRRLLQAAEVRDKDFPEALTRRQTSRDMSTASFSSDPMDRVQALANLMYGESLVLDGAASFDFVTGVDHAVLAWTGQPLDGATFHARSWLRNGAEVLHFGIIANPPVANDSERRIIEAFDVADAGLGIEPSNTVVVTAIATMVAAHYVDKATNEIDHAVGHEVRQWEKAGRVDNQYYANLARARQIQRAQYRNMAVAADTLPIKDTVQPPASGSIEELLRVRIKALRRRRPDGDDDPA